VERRAKSGEQRAESKERRAKSGEQRAESKEQEEMRSGGERLVPTIRVFILSSYP